MKAAVAEPRAMHRAALSLHALNAADRDWVLEGLTAEQRGLLQPLLSELRELGIPADPSLLDGPATPPERAGVLHALDEAGVRRLAALLAPEPPRATSVLLAAAEWPWRDRLLAQLPVALASEVQRHGRMCAAAPALVAEAVAQIERRMAAAHEPARPAPLWVRLRHGLGGWRSSR